MKLVTYRYQDHVSIGAVVADQIVALAEVAPNMLSLIARGADGLAQAAAAASAGKTTVSLADVHLQAPIPLPARNVTCLGLNYAAHAAESYAAKGRAASLPQVPILFTKATTSVIGPHDPIPFDPAVSTQMDWEVELAVIIGRRGKNIAAADAMSYVFGYTVLNDVSARDLQMAGKQYFKGKSLDGGCPMGPWIVTAAALPDPHALRLTCRVNGVLKQDSANESMIFDIPTTIAYLSKGMTLLPGDIIATGTPSGVGFARTPPEFLQPGDVLESEIEQIGALRNEVVASQ